MVVMVLSYLNSAHRDVAIVSEVEGTTRDALEARVEMSSIPVIFTDTAGIRNSRDFIETEGVLRAFARYTFHLTN